MTEPNIKAVGRLLKSGHSLGSKEVQKQLNDYELNIMVAERFLDSNLMFTRRRLKKGKPNEYHIPEVLEATAPLESALAHVRVGRTTIRKFLGSSQSAIPIIIDALSRKTVNTSHYGYKRRLVEEIVRQRMKEAERQDK